METKRPREPSPLTMAGSPPPSPLPSSSESVVPLAFTGSRERDVALAKSFWNSVSLQPTLESRLGPRRASGGGGGSGSGSRKGSTAVAAGAPVPNPADNTEVEETERKEWKEKYLEKAKKREEIIALLKKQRDERISKEMLSNLHKPKSKAQQRSQEGCERKESIMETNLEDEESVKALP